MTTPDKSPMSNEVLGVHLEYLRHEQHSTRADVQKVLAGMSEMATKTDLENMSKRFVTTDRFEAFEKKVDAGTISNSFDRWIVIITKVGTAGAVLTTFIGLVVAFVRYSDKLTALIK